MNQDFTSIRHNLTTPRAAAVAGIVFATISTVGHLLIRSSIPPNPLGSASQFANSKVSLTLNLTPFGGIAFLWFIGVVRDRIGKLEDRFFATVFLGSGLLYVALIFCTAAITGGLVTVLGSGNENVVQSGAYAVSRATVYQILNIYAIKMAAVFMISFSTIAVRARIGPRWQSFLGYALALVLLLTIRTFEWIPIVFPLWVYVISVTILFERFRGQSDTEQASVSAVP
jgi:hypothetical protein